MLHKILINLRDINKRRLASRAKRKAEGDITLATAADDLRQAISLTKGIPLLVVSYNNGIYVANTVSQMARLGITPIIIDNASTDSQTRHILSEIQRQGAAQVVYSRKNYGHLVGFMEPMYQVLPDVFAYTDPDLQLHPEIPKNFMEILANLTIEYDAYKVGCALQLEYKGVPAHADNRYIISVRKPFLFRESYDVQRWEQGFWKKKISHPELEIYAAPLDTTLSVYNKSMYRGDFIFNSLRVAGCFSAIHLPWFPEVDIMTDAQRVAYLQGNVSSTWRTNS
ncbi:glycosyltransferase [Aquabacterium sp.]|uniref:glycosyltransferase n=1 Tax=Aquabacterium sp. TaxID=1872578 RepID=UPI003BB042A6